MNQITAKKELSFKYNYHSSCLENAKENLEYVQKVLNNIVPEYNYRDKEKEENLKKITELISSLERVKYLKK